MRGTILHCVYSYNFIVIIIIALQHELANGESCMVFMLTYLSGRRCDGGKVHTNNFIAIQ